MGFNIAGLVIDKNYQNDLEGLSTILGQQLLFSEKVDFEQASENWKEDTYCDIYFHEEATLIFLSMEECANEVLVPNQVAFNFVLSEMSMVFSVHYTNNEQLVRALVVLEDETRPIDLGEKFAFELEETDPSELIYHLFEQTLGKSFWSIEPDEENVYRYHLK